MAAPKKYSDELRERATRLALESGRPIAHVAQDLGVHKEALRTWVRQAKADAAGGTPTVLSSAEREELKRLRGEVRELRQANEILRAASVYLRNGLDGTPRRCAPSSTPRGRLASRSTSSAARSWCPSRRTMTARAAAVRHPRSAISSC